MIIVWLRIRIKIKKHILLNAREFYKGQREILIAFEENIFPLPKLYVFGENEWKEKDIPGNKKYMPKTFDLRKKMVILNSLKKNTNFYIEILGIKILMN